MNISIPDAYKFHILYKRGSRGERPREFAQYVCDELEKDSLLKPGYIADRDALPGRDIFREFDRIVKISQYTICAIDPEFLGSEFNIFRNQLAFKDLLERQQDDNREFLVLAVGVEKTKIIKKCSHLRLDEILEVPLDRYREDSRWLEVLKKIMLEGLMPSDVNLETHFPIRESTRDPSVHVLFSNSNQPQLPIAAVSPLSTNGTTIDSTGHMYQVDVSNQPESLFASNTDLGSGFTVVSVPEQDGDSESMMTSHARSGISDNLSLLLDSPEAAGNFENGERISYDNNDQAHIHESTTDNRDQTFVKEVELGNHDQTLPEQVISDDSHSASFSSSLSNSVTQSQETHYCNSNQSGNTHITPNNEIRLTQNSKQDKNHKGGQQIVGEQGDQIGRLYLKNTLMSLISGWIG